MKAVSEAPPPQVWGAGLRAEPGQGVLSFPGSPELRLYWGGAEGPLKRRGARMSSSVREGNSASLSCGVIPAAGEDRTAETVIRLPRRHGFAPRLPGSRVMRGGVFLKQCPRACAKAQASAGRSNVHSHRRYAVMPQGRLKNSMRPGPMLAEPAAATQRPGNSRKDTDNPLHSHPRSVSSSAARPACLVKLDKSCASPTRPDTPYYLHTQRKKARKRQGNWFSFCVAPSN